MLDRLSVRALAWLIGGSACALLAAAYVWIAGSAVVVDETGGVSSAFITTGDGREQPLRRLWSSYFYAIPRPEGSIEVRCGDGARKSAGYVAAYLDTRIRVVGHTPCATLIDES